jgi:hypothetical protein
MTLMERLFSIRPADGWYLFTGGLLVLLSAFRKKYAQNFTYRLLIMASLLIWVVIFNHKAESPTYIICMYGIGLWATTVPQGVLKTVLLTAAFLFISLATTDLFPPSIRQDFFIHYALKALPAVVIWIFIQWRLLTGNYFAEDNQTNV